MRDSSCSSTSLRVDPGRGRHVLWLLSDTSTQSLCLGGRVANDYPASRHCNSPRAGVDLVGLRGVHFPHGEVGVRKMC